MEELTFEQKLERYHDAGFPIIYIKSFEEDKTDGVLRKVLGNTCCFEWNGTQRVKNLSSGNFYKNSLEQYLTDIIDSGITDELPDGSILILKDIHHYLEDPVIVSMLKHICLRIVEELSITILMVSPIVVIPKEIEKFITIIEPSFPTEKEIESLIDSFAQEQGLDVTTDMKEEMALALKGLTDFEVKSILRSAMARDGSLSREDLELIHTQKQQMIQKSGILEMIYQKEKMEDIGGLEILKEWLTRKTKVYKEFHKAKAFGVDMPKGVLIAGMPGCGKSLTAKVTAQLFDVPLLRLDIGKIMGKYVGESEENMHRAIALAEAISPCVLWVDELEKAFAGIGSGGDGHEVTIRLFGTFLTWMQEKTGPVFVIATANNITKLPPELLRKGRFDEIFYVALPNLEERKKIFTIHIQKRSNGRNDLQKIDLQKLVDKTSGYSGADIEGVVKEAVEHAFVEDKPGLTTEYLLKAIENTHSLSEIMKDELDKMAKIYKDRKFKSASKEH